MSQIVSKVGKTYGKRLFAEHLDQYTPQDPLYEFYTDERGVERRRKRLLPPGLSKRDAKILKSVKKRAHYLDKGFSLFGLRFGWTFFISLIPIIGDLSDAALNYRLVVHKARKADIPPWLLRRMLFNNAVSAGVSLVPIVGDVVLAMYKANSRNAFLLEEFLRIRGEEFLRMGGVVEEEEVGRSGWLNGLVNRAGGKGGVSKKDAEQVKPGAGMTKEELKVAGKAGAGGGGGGPVVGTGKSHKRSTTVGTDSTAVDSISPHTKPGTAAGKLAVPGGNGVDSAAASSTNSKSQKSQDSDGSATGKKRSHSGGSFFFGSSKKNKTKTPPISGSGVPDKGRFVENVQ